MNRKHQFNYAPISHSYTDGGGSDLVAGQPVAVMKPLQPNQRPLSRKSPQLSQRPLLLRKQLFLRKQLAVPTAVATGEAPTIEPTAESSVVDQSLIDITWEWVQRTSNLGEEILIAVPNPENYTLLFDAEGMFTTQLDCNNAAGAYTSFDPGSILMELGPMTQAVCSPDSLAGEMVNMFGPAQSYVFEENGQVVIFKWVAAGPWDFFRQAGSTPAEPDAGEGESEIDDLEPAEITLDLQGLAQSYEWQIVDASPIPPGPGGQRISPAPGNGF